MSKKFIIESSKKEPVCFNIWAADLPNDSINLAHGGKSEPIDEAYLQSEELKMALSLGWVSATEVPAATAKTGETSIAPKTTKEGNK